MSPECTPQTKKTNEELIARYPKKEAALLPVLHLAQQEFGFISVEEEKLVANLLGIKPIKVREVVTFHTMLNQKPVGKYHIQVCTNLSCTLLGGQRLLDYLRKKLQLEPGETSADKKYTLSSVECLGACEQSPCLMVNFDYYGQLDRQKIDEILEGLK